MWSCNSAADGIEKFSALVAGCLLFVLAPAGLTANDKPAETDVESTADATEYLLRYRFVPGEVLRYDSQESTTLKTMVGPAAKNDVTLVSQIRRFEVGDVADSGQASVTMQYEKVRMQLTSGDAPSIEFDSSMKPDEVPREFKGVADQLKKSAPSYELQPMGPPIIHDDVVQEMVVDGSSAKHSASFTIPLPEQAVKVGDSWKVNYVAELRIGENLKRKVLLLRTYRLAKVEGDIATISFSTSITTRVGTPAQKSQLIKSTPQGTIEFDIARGLLVKRDMKHSKTVFNALGPNTMLTSVGHTTETLLSRTEGKTAATDSQQAAEQTPTDVSLSSASN